jgi:hypothetical protein
MIAGIAADAQTSPVPTNGLRMWLRADAGVTADANNQIAIWADQSSNGNNVTQVNTANQPALVGNAMNGQPVVHFNGSSSYLTLPSGLNSNSALPVTLVVVTRSATSLQGLFDSAPNQANTFRFFSNYVELWSQSPCVTLAPPSSGAITSVISQANGSNNRTLDVYLNGLEQGGGVKTGNNSPVAIINGQIGRINSGYYYNGDIAEVLFYNRALSSDERVQVEAYLNTKYGVAVPSAFAANPISSTQAALTWTPNSATGVQIERQDGASGTFAVVANLSGSQKTYVDGNLNPGIQYTYRISGTGGLGVVANPATQTVTLPAGIPTVPTAGLNLWVTAGAGVTSPTGNNQVSAWSDLSGQGNDVAQTISGNQPTLVSNVMNGQSVVRFNGASTYLNFSAALNSSNALPLSVFVVTRGTNSLQGAFDSAPNLQNTFRFFQNYVDLWSQSPLITLVPPATGAITSVVTRINGAGDRQMDAYLNGAQAGHAIGNTSPLVFNNGQIGRINSGYYYNGDIAEVLVYNQALSDAERQQVETYLSAKYAIVQPPATPMGVVVSQIDSTENLVTWGTTPTSGEITYQVWRQDATGQWVLAGTVTGAGTYLDSGLSPNATYSYKVLATSIGGTSAFSDPITVNQNGLNVANVPTNGMQLWLMGDGTWESSLEFWQDYSGNGNNALQSNTANQPTVTPAVLNGKPVVHFNGASAQYLALPNLLPGAPAGEIITVVRTTNTTSNSAPWTFGTGNGEWYLYSSNGGVYSDFGSTAQKNEGVPVQDITQFHVYEESSQSGLWQSWIDGLPFYQTQSNTVGFPTSPFIGKGLVGYFSGDIAEVIVYNRTLSDDERESVRTYLNQKYALQSAPATPTGLKALALNATTNLVTWDSPVTNSEVNYQVWRQEGSGTWTLAATMENVGTFIDTGLNLNASYTYKIIAVNGVGCSAFSDSVTVVPNTDQVSVPPTDGMELWLMADGAWESPVGYLPDYSGNGNDAWQTAGNNFRPTVTATGPNGKPALHFDSSLQQRLNLPDFLSSASAGEIIAVVKAANTAVNNGLWNFGTGYADSYLFAQNGCIYGDFGSTVQKSEGFPQTDITQFHILDESSQAGAWQSWIDGSPFYQTSNNVVGFNHAPSIGAFNGDISEVLVYNRPLSPVERATVQQYLAAKYAMPSYSTLNPVVNLNGSSFSGTSGVWAVNGSSVVCGIFATGTNPDNTTRRGTIDYSFNTSSAGIWQFQISAQPVGAVYNKEVTIPSQVYLDGVHLGDYNLSTYNGAVGTISGLTQNLPAGTHDFQIVNMNPSGVVNLQINNVLIDQPSGTDQNGSGVADWLYKQLQSENVVNPVLATSYVNPICIEGKARMPEQAVLTSGTWTGGVLNEGNGQWYQNVPLNMDGSPTAITATFEGGLVSSTSSVTWAPLNVIAANGTTLSIRSGDSLLLTGYPVGSQPGGPLSITVSSGTDVIYSGTSTADAPIPYQFATSGTYSVQASWNGGTPFAITVQVESADFGASLFAYVGDGQAWQLPNVATDLTVQWDNHLSTLQNTPPATGGYSFNVTPTVSGTYYGVARLYPGGPIVARGEVDAYNRYDVFATGDTRVIGTNPDGSQLVSASIAVDALPPGGYAEVVLFIGGECFPDGTTTKIIPASDFVNGVATFEVDWANSHSICHYVLLFNAQGQQVGSL